MNIDATAGGVSANSYCDVVFANAYFQLRLNSSDWLNATDPNKESALVSATQIIDSVFEWVGLISTNIQSLRWPRRFAYKRDSFYDIFNDGYGAYDETIVPDIIKKATCELAISLLTNNGYDASVNDLDRIRISSIAINFDPNVGVAAIPQPVIELLYGLGEFVGNIRGGARSVRLVRV